MLRGARRRQQTAWERSLTETNQQWWTHGVGGFVDPVNGFLALRGARAASEPAPALLDAVDRGLKAAGWLAVKPASARGLVRYVGAMAGKGAGLGLRPLVPAGVRARLIRWADHVLATEQSSGMKLLGRPDVRRYARLDGKSFLGRYHVRVFAHDAADGRADLAFAVHRDTKILLNPFRGLGFLTHDIEPNTDLARDRLLRDLRAAGQVGDGDVAVIENVPYGDTPRPNGTRSVDRKAYRIELARRP